MLHLGDFDPDRSGLEVYQCYETGTTRSSLRSALTGENYIAFDSETSGDEGRAMIADIDPDFPGCEMWMYDQVIYSSVDGSNTGGKAGSCNFAIWFSGSANRQPMNGTTIDQYKGSRVFTLYRYDVTTINSSKRNPCFYGDIFGDWREEVILPTHNGLELRIFSTWYPTEYKVPYLMSDYIYKMSAMNQQVGYNQPTHLGYYLGSDNAENFKPVSTASYNTAIEDVKYLGSDVNRGPEAYADYDDTIYVSSADTEIQSVAIYSINGTLLHQNNNIGKNQYIYAYNKTDKLLIVKVTTDQGTKSIKVLIK